MNLKNKIVIILGLCLVLCVGAYFIIARMFDNVENQLFEKCRIEVLVGSRVMSDTIEFMVNTYQLREADVFDTNYVEIKGTNPKKYSTRYDKAFDKIIQKIEDEFMQDEDVLYSVLVDRNGYVPTHNSIYSRPDTSDVAYNLKFSRSKRIYNDVVGMKAARFEGKGTLKQLYHRDTGETMWDIAAPVKVKGKHWGAFRIGVSLSRIEEIKNQMVLLIGMTMFVILSATMLMLFMIIPRRLYDTDLNVPRY